MSQAFAKKQQMEYFSLFIMIISCILFRIQVGDIGIGYMLAVLVIYETIWIIFGERFSDVIGRIIRSKYSKGKSKLARAVWKKGFTIQLVTGFLISVLLVVAGTLILSKGFGFVHSYYLVWFLAPTLFLRMLSEAFCGFLSGRNYDMASGFSFIIRQIIILVMGSALSMAVKEYGKKVAALLKQEDFASIYGNLGILISAFVAEIIVLIFLMIIRLNIKRRINDYEDDYYHRSENTGNVLLIAWQRRFGENLNLFLLIIPVFVILIFFNGIFETEVEFAKNVGLLASATLAPCALVVVAGYILVLPILAKYYSFIKKHEMRYARNSFQAGLHLCFIIGFGGAAVFISIGKNISSVISADNADILKTMLIYGSFCIVLSLVSIYLLKTLQLLGFGLFAGIVEVVDCVLFGLILNALLRSNLTVLNAVLIAMIIYFAIAVIAYLAFVLLKLDMVINPVSDSIIPLFCAALGGVAGFLLAKLMSPHLGNIFTFIVCMLVILFLYLVLLMFFRNFRENEIEYIPGKKFILALGQMLHIM